MVLSISLLALTMIINVSFAATDKIAGSKSVGSLWEDDFKSPISNLKMHYDYDNNGALKKVNCNFTTKKKNYLIKSVVMRYESGSAKTYNAKNKKSITINIPKDNYSGLYYTITYSNNIVEDNSNFTSNSHYGGNYFAGKKVKFTQYYKASPDSGNPIGKIKYTIDSKKKSTKIKQVTMKFSYRSNGKLLYKPVKMKVKGKNTVVKEMPNKYSFVSANIVY